MLMYNTITPIRCSFLISLCSSNVSNGILSRIPLEKGRDFDAKTITNHVETTWRYSEPAHNLFTGWQRIPWHKGSSTCPPPQHIVKTTIEEQGHTKIMPAMKVASLPHHHWWGTSEECIKNKWTDVAVQTNDNSTHHQDSQPSILDCFHRWVWRTLNFVGRQPSSTKIDQSTLQINMRSHPSGTATGISYLQLPQCPGSFHI